MTYERIDATTLALEYKSDSMLLKPFICPLIATWGIDFGADNLLVTDQNKKV